MKKNQSKKKNKKEKERASFKKLSSPNTPAVCVPHSLSFSFSFSMTWHTKNVVVLDLMDILWDLGFEIL